MKRIQNRIAESRFALPATAAYALLVCLANGLVEQGLWVQLALLAASTLLMVELNNANALIRIYSRMVSCSFLVLSSMATFLFPSIDGAVAAMSLIVFFLIIFHAYQDNTSTGWVFYAFAAIGVGTVAFVQLFFFVPVLWILLGTMVLALGVKTFVASILGLAIPYWFLAAWYASTRHFDLFIRHFTQLAVFDPVADFSHLNIHELVTYGFIVLMAIVGSIHFLRTSYNDKIRLRMIYESLIAVDFCAILFLVLQPQHSSTLIRLAIVTTAPLIGHYIALTKTRLTNISFIVIVMAAVGITIWNLWTPSPLF